MEFLLLTRFCVKHVFHILDLKASLADLLDVEAKFRESLKTLKDHYAFDGKSKPHFIDEDVKIFLVKTSYLIHQVFQLANHPPVDTSLIAATDEVEFGLDSALRQQSVNLFKHFFYLVLKFEIDTPLILNQLDENLEMVILKALHFKLGIHDDSLIIFYDALNLPEMTQSLSWKDYIDFETSWSAQLSRHLAEQQLIDQNNEIRFSKILKP